METRTNYLINLLGDNLEARMAIRELPLFHTSSEDLLELSFRYGRIFSLRQGETLTREGEFDQWVYFIINGSLDVLVGGEKVDTITSSLVGERCILGEPRKATLQAGEGGINALGVDMALLDALQDPQQSERENFPVYLELLGRIVGEIVQRVAEMELNRLGIAHRHQIIRQAERDTEVIEQLKNNEFSSDKSTCFAIYKYLNRHEPVLLSEATMGNPLNIDTRRIYILCLEWNRPDVLLQLAREILVLNGNGSANSAAGNNPTGISMNFRDFLKQAAEVISKRHHEVHGEAPPIPLAEINLFFSLNYDFEIDLRGLSAWLRQIHGYSEKELAKVMMVLLREVSSYTALVNGEIKQLLSEMKELDFIKSLGTSVESPLSDVSEFFGSTPPEDLIPFFSKHILEVHLIHPYQESLANWRDPDHATEAHKGPTSGPGSDKTELLGNLFD